MNTIRAIYRNGVFSPISRVDAPNGSEVILDAQEVGPEAQAKSMAGIYRILNRRYRTGQRDTAARHNEHQP
jgi:predicted DNA-binding antitoxin AbrB/MazE fold protein